MKKWMLSMMLFVLLATATYTQNLPNGGFEDWSLKTLYMEPDNWRTSNFEAFFADTLTAFSSDDSYSGNTALLLKSATGYAFMDDDPELDTLFGYAATGTISGDEGEEGLAYSGGFPIDAYPDSLFGYFKCNLAPDDTALIVVSLKENGNELVQDMFFIGDNYDNYTRLGFELSQVGGSPDSAFIAFACSDPDNSQSGSWLLVDSIWFDKISGTIPNYDFEDWSSIEYEDPDDWMTGNMFSVPESGIAYAVKTTDAHSGSYALEMSNFEAMFMFGQLFSVVTVEFDGILGQEFPRVPIDFNPSGLEFYYKFESSELDTAQILASLMDDSLKEWHFDTILVDATEYTQVVWEFDYPNDVTIIEAGIVASGVYGLVDESGSPRGHVGSTLWFDDISLIDPCIGKDGVSIQVTEPDCENDAILDAGTGWESIEWSTQETTQTITVAPGTYSVSVTDADGCGFDDEVTVDPPTGCGGTPVKAVSLELISSIHPNPSTGIVYLTTNLNKGGSIFIEVVSITGSQVYQEDVYIQNKNQTMDINLTSYPKGMYFVKISNEGRTEVYKLLLD